jgi:ABC-2 type transport system permease protein
MKNLLTIAYYELKKILRNPRLMILVLSQPIVIALIVGLIFYHDPENIKIGLIVPNKNKYTDEIENKLKDNSKIEFISYNEVDTEDIKAGKVRGFLTLDIQKTEPIKGNIDFLNDPTGKITGAEVLSEVYDAVSDISKEIAKNDINNQIEKNIKDIKKAVSGVLQTQLPEIKINSEYIEPIKLSDSDATPFHLKTFDYYASAIMVLLVILVVLNLAGISITSERLSGTFERLFVTPYSKVDVILGKALAQFIVGLIVAILGMASLYLAYKISIGNFGLIILINILVVLATVAAGLLISAVTYTIAESIELAMYIFFISVLTTGILAPLETAYKYFVYFIKINPFYYAVDASRRVNMLGAGWNNISSEIYILAFSFLVFLTLAVVLLRREAR